MNEDLKQRGGRTLSAVHNTPAASVPPSRCAQRSITRGRQMVADPPEKHLRRHTLVDAVEQLFDEARACLSDCELQWASAFELPLGRPKPVPFPCAAARSRPCAWWASA